MGEPSNQPRRQRGFPDLGSLELLIVDAGLDSLLGTIFRANHAAETMIKPVVAVRRLVGQFGVFQPQLPRPCSGTLTRPPLCRRTLCLRRRCPRG